MEVKYPWECSLTTGERLLLRDSARLSTLNTDYGRIGSLLRYWARPTNFDSTFDSETMVKSGEQRHCGSGKPEHCQACTDKGGTRPVSL